VLILASGNVVHNLRRIDWDRPDEGFDWARRFDDAVVRQLASDPTQILEVTRHADYPVAVPTPDHFIPLLYIAGLAAASDEVLEPAVRGYAMGSLSMTCYGLGADLRCEMGEGAATIPESVPPDDTNI
jgi:4,5-DOPA dioxygenase extradiol